MKRLLIKLIIFILVYMSVLTVVTLCWVDAECMIEGVAHTSRVDGGVACILAYLFTLEIYRFDKKVGCEKDA